MTLLEVLLEQTTILKKMANQMGLSGDAMRYHNITQILKKAVSENRDLTEDEDAVLGRYIEEFEEFRANS